MDIDYSLFDDYYLLVFDGQDIDLIHRTIHNGKSVDKKTSGIVKDIQLGEYYKTFDISKRRDILIQLFKNCLEKKIISTSVPKPYVFVFTNDAGFSDNFLTDILYYPVRVTSREFAEILNELKIPFSKFTIINNKYYDFINQVRSNLKDKRLNEKKGGDVARKLSRSYQAPLSVRELFTCKNMPSRTFEESEDVFGIQKSNKSSDYFDNEIKKKMSQSTAETTAFKDFLFTNKNEDVRTKSNEGHINMSKNPSLEVPAEAVQARLTEEVRQVTMDLIFDSYFDRFQLFAALQEKGVGKVFAIKFNDEMFYELIHYDIEKMFGITNDLSDITSRYMKNIHSLSDFNLDSVKQYQTKGETEKIRSFVYNLIFLNMSLYHSAITNLCRGFREGKNTFIDLFKNYFHQELIKKYSEDIRKSEGYDEPDVY